MNAAEDFNQRRLARAVFADESNDFPGAEIKIERSHGARAAKGFSDAAQLEKAGGHGCVFSLPGWRSGFADRAGANCQGISSRDVLPNAPGEGNDSFLHHDSVG